ncbi:MAG: hypothetical protein GF347_02365 [Candidatus Moranbacteria bacterium]|nr:hypothetical protein [Candidatus Moranbacteria bacterium]
MQKLFIISGPSGAGENTLVEALEKIIDVEKVITTTTREKRGNEKQGKPYYFISKEEFKKGIKEDRFFEYALQDRGNYYGVTQEEIKRVLKSDKPALYRLDYKGVISLKKMMPEETVAILITAPLDVLEARIRRREKVTEKFVKARLDYAKGWYKNAHYYDYQVENKEGQLDQTVEKILGIIKKESQVVKN